LKDHFGYGAAVNDEEKILHDIFEQQNILNGV